MVSRLTIFLTGCVTLFGQPPVSGQTPAPPTWTVTGTVVDSITGRPIADALVIWEPSFSAYGFRDRPADSTGPAANSARLTTDAAGSFTFKVDPTATGVRLFVSRQGYSAQDGKQAANLSLPAAASQTTTIRLVPQSTVEGRVVNGAGEPMPGIEVHAVRIEIHDGLRRPREDIAKATDQNGAFHFDGLPTGAYYILASGQYFPVAATLDQAQILQVAAGKVVSANFSIENREAYQIRGLITNMPLRRTVAIRLLRDGGPLSKPFQATPNGTFQVTDVAPGSYTLQAYTPGTVPPDFGEVEVIVGEGNAAGLKVILSEGVDVYGHIEFRGSGSLEKYALVRATPFYPQRLPVEESEIIATMRPNGNFVLKNLLPGKYEVTVRGLADSYLAEVHTEAEGDSKDVLEEGLTITTKASPPLAILMRAGGAEITGNVVGAAPGQSFSVALISRRGDVDIPAVLHAPDGRVHIAGLTPGDYTLLAWPESRELEYRNPSVLTAFSAYKMDVSVTDGTRRTVSLTPVP